MQCIRFWSARSGCDGAQVGKQRVRKDPVLITYFQSVIAHREQVECLQAK